ncbi:HAD family hydrolase [Alkaliphilus transvaalensis]|uniref:HAD family hydrolase n=1 Tax=Alkaliphilus transvaalensis TaxID=114628 RepID=UPI00047EC75B|nr:HAD family hydrolase [Alkaliphilus transvaalensis]
MLFASDLDGTLIFSRRYLESMGKSKIKRIRSIEEIDGKETSYISQTVIEKLKFLNNKAFFVPVTTRSLHQYNRITLFKNEIKPHYAIISNGGIILEKGVPMMEWQLKIQDRLSKQLINRDVVLRKFEETKASKWVTSMKEVDGLFVYFLLDREKIQREELNPFLKWLKKKAWTGSLQGRKLYLIPNCINKRDPVLFLMKKIGQNHFASAGDSFLDLPMLMAADYKIIPSHGELVECLGESLKKEGIKYTCRRGIDASEEIVDFGISLLEDHHS